LEVEWSVNIETVWLVHSLDWFLIELIEIDDSPFLVQTAVLTVVSDNVLSFLVLALVDIEDLGLVRRLDVLSNILESIPPSVSEVSAFEVVAASIALYMHGVTGVGSRSDGLGSVMEVEELTLEAVSRLELDIISNGL